LKKWQHNLKVEKKKKRTDIAEKWKMVRRNGSGDTKKMEQVDSKKEQRSV